MQRSGPSAGEEGCAEPFVKFKICPIHVTINVLGKKWTILLLREIALHHVNRFNQIKRALPGITARVLILRLQELEAAGFIYPEVLKEKPRVVEWRLTDKGRDTIPILLSILAFGVKWYAHEVFEDKQPRSIEELYPLLYEKMKGPVI